LPECHRIFLKRIQEEFAKAKGQNRLPAVLVISVQKQIKRIDGLQQDDKLDKRLASLVKQTIKCWRFKPFPALVP
jgi:hypothetical protein